MCMSLKKLNLTAAFLLSSCFCAPMALADNVQATQATSNATGQTPTSAVNASGPTVAQANIGMTAQDVGVMDRPRPAYDAKGVPLGGFRLFPTLDLTGSYDDNIFRQPDGLDDYYLTVVPQAYLRSQWGRHFIELYAGSESYFYSDYTDENLTDWRYGMDGRVDITRAITFLMNTYFSEQHEDWQTPNTETGYQAEPNRYFQIHSNAALNYKANRVGIEAGGTVDNFNYRYTPLIGGGSQDNNDRDRKMFTAYGQLSYDFSPGYNGFVKATYDERDFAQFYDRSGNHRSSHGYHVDAGLNLQLTHLVSGKVFVGYLNQAYSAKVEDSSDTPLKDFSGFDFGANLDWYADQMLTVHLTASRTVSDVTSSGASGSDNKSVKLSADYEMLQNFILQANANYMYSKYIGSDTKYKYPGFGISAIYMINKYFGLKLGYDYSKRSAGNSSSEFTDNKITLSVTTHI